MRILLILLFAVFPCPFLYGEVPQHIRLSWNRNQPDTTLTISWNTTIASSAFVQYGQDSIAEYQAEGINFYSFSCGQYINIVELKNLKPDREYLYRCGEKGAWSKAHTFKTGLEKGKSEFTFIAYGDTRSQINEVFRIKQSMLRYNPDFILHTGDFVNNGKNQEQWNVWFSTMQDLLADTPLMGTMGNHDHGALNYHDQFVFPGNEKYYSFDYGNAHFVCVYNPTRGTRITPNTELYIWLDNNLRIADSDPDIKWKLAFWHAPAYNARGYKRDKKLLEDLYPLLEKYNVDIAICGHAHHYERTYMLKKNKIIQKGPDFRGEGQTTGIITVVTGGGGAPLIDAGQQWWTAVSKKAYHFCLITIIDQTLILKTIQPDSTVIDQFVIIK